VPQTAEVRNGQRYGRAVAHRSDPAFHVLHRLRLRGRLDLDALAAAMGVPAGEVQRLLDAAAADGLVVHRDGRIAGWSLTPDGRARHLELLQAERDAAACAAEVDDSYQRFLELNLELVAVCTRWQLLDEHTLNDHSDRAHDERVIAELHGIDDRAQPVCAALADTLSRMASYPTRLTTALGRIDGSEPQWFTSPAIDSYHTVWFELHEDLLQTLGIERGEGR